MLFILASFFSRRLRSIGGLLNLVRAIRDLPSYTDEVLFFKSVKLRSKGRLERDVLCARIRELAHGLEKDIFDHEKPRFNHLKKEFKTKTDLWKKRFSRDEPTFRWAIEVLDLCRGGPTTPDKLRSYVGREDFLGLIKSRRSVRTWKGGSIPEHAIVKLIEAAIWAPSSCNRQPCRFLVVGRKDERKFLGSILPGGIGFAKKAPLHIVVSVDARFYRLPQERHTIFLDGAAAIENMLLMAHHLGLGACWLNWVVNKMNDERFRKKFKVPQYLLPVALIAMGFPALVPKPRARRRIEDVVTYA